MKPTRLELHIDELVLHGFPSTDRDAIATGVRTRLAGLLAEGGLPGSLLDSGRVDHLDAGQYEPAPDAPARHTGDQVAAAVYRGLGG
jgi:hypothetical protein